MSTVTERPRQTEHGFAKSNGATPVLDKAIEQTTKRQSLVRDAANVLGVPVDKLLDLLRNVWKTSKDQPPLTDQEMFVGISMIARFELDPIAKEVYVTRGKGGVFTIISIDGWIKVLDRTDHYDGFTVEIHEDDKGHIEWVETVIHSTKRSHPTTYRAYMSEYSRIAGMVAKQIPSHMLRIFSLRHAARLFTPVGGAVLTEEEAVYIAREQPAQQASPQRLDELTEKLSQPIPQQAAEQDDLPETSYEPDTRDDWQKFNDAVAAAKTLAELNLAVEHHGGKDFGATRNTEALGIVRDREAAIREKKASNKELLK